MLAAPDRIGVDAEVIRRTLDGRLKIAPDGTVRTSERYLLIGRNGAGRPDPVQAAWLYAQMVRWGQAPLSDELRRRRGRIPPRSLRRRDWRAAIQCAASRAMASAPSWARLSMPPISRAISRPGARSARAPSGVVR